MCESRTWLALKSGLSFYFAVGDNPLQLLPMVFLLTGPLDERSSSMLGLLMYTDMPPFVLPVSFDARSLPK